MKGNVCATPAKGAPFLVKNKKLRVCNSDAVGREGILSVMSEALTDPILLRIREALEAARETLAPFSPGAIAGSQKSSGRGPVTEADRAVDRVLREKLLHKGEGWLSEESTDNRDRLGKSHVWVVDPLDGTLEFMHGI